MTVDLWVTGGVLHTQGPSSVSGPLDALPAGLPDSFAVVDGRITWVGYGADAPDDVRRAARRVDLGGRTVLPGFVDAHNHVRLGSDAECAQLAGADDLAEVGRRLQAWATEHPDAVWVEGEGYTYAGLANGAHPTAAMLDELVADRACAVFSYDVHTLWLNTAAMELLGVTSEQQPFGTPDLDATGAPTGFLTDFAIRGLSRDGMRALKGRGLPWASADRQYRRLLGSLDHAIACGITTIVEPQNSPDDLALFQRAREEGRLRSRLHLAMFHPVGTTDADRAEFAELARTHDDDRLRVGSLKLYIDDVVEPHTAALHAPYANEPGHCGQTYYAPDEFAELVTRLDAEGFQLFVHATGDRGISTVLDAVAAARATNGPRDARHQVVHVECLRAQDVSRFAELGVVACMQPRHASPEIAGPGHAWADAVGAHRWGQAWPMRSLAEAGAVLALSSDWNVAEMEPMVGVQAAVTRAPLDGGEPWMPEEAISLQAALEGYTLGSAYAIHAEGNRGCLTPGHYADFVVLDADPYVTPPEKLATISVLQTWVGGACVYDARSAD